MRDNKYALIAGLFCAALAMFTTCNPDDAPAPIGLPVEMVWIPGGSFEMGDTAGGGFYDERPVHTVTVSGFYLGKYEVTQVQYKAVMGNNPASGGGYDNGGYRIEGGYPVYFVTWYDAVEFCNRLSEREGLTPVYTITDRTPAIGYPIKSATVMVNWSSNGYRLPTEAEWEYAAKGGNGSPGNYLYAGSNTPGDVAWYAGNNSNSKARDTQTVGTKVPNGLGLYDMSGNVSEWCWDWEGDYSGEAQTDPVGPSSGSYRVTRGGGGNEAARRIRSAFRGIRDPSIARGRGFGFRLARSQGNGDTFASTP